jgi:hypothetical protein
MPIFLMPWNAISGQGKPTRSIEVNTLIKKVKKKEVRKQGVASKARCAITHVEFRRFTVSSGRIMMYFAAIVFRAY